jgi:hypothetical protein
MFPNAVAITRASYDATLSGVIGQSEIFAAHHAWCAEHPGMSGLLRMAVAAAIAAARASEGEDYYSAL